MVYLHTHLVDFHGINVGRYTIPMVPLGYARHPKSSKYVVVRSPISLPKRCEFGVSNLPPIPTDLRSDWMSRLSSYDAQVPKHISDEIGLRDAENLSVFPWCCKIED